MKISKEACPGTVMENLNSMLVEILGVETLFYSFI